MSRREAKRRITLENHEKTTAAVECRKDTEVLDESPAAYKDIDKVMAAQADLVEIVHTLRVLVQTGKGLGDNGLWRIATLHGILYLLDVGSKTTSFSSACAGIFASN